MGNSNQTSNILYSNCHSGWPSEVCAFANVCGLINTVVWFLVFLPQIYRNFRHRSVKGLSPYWIIGSFTAGLNNLFFVFKWGVLPIFVKISGCYSPVIQGVMLIQIFIFTPFSRRKIVATCLCLIVWLTFIFLQVFLTAYDWIQWITVILWGIGSYPQVILNMSRQSTQGLSVVMVCLRTSSIIPWFFSTYLLMLPNQNVILCYFGGTGGLLLALQVIYFWKQPPRSTLASTSNKALGDKIENKTSEISEEAGMEKLNDKSISLTCNIFRLCSSVFLLFFLVGYVFALMWRLHSFIVLVAPVGIIIVLANFHFYFTTCYGTIIRKNIKRLFSCKSSSDLITVKL